MPALEETIAFVKEKHRGQTDKAGRPYWEHPARVMARCRQLADAARVRQNTDSRTMSAFLSMGKPSFAVGTKPS